jgi:hypothetical protein
LTVDREPIGTKTTSIVHHYVSSNADASSIDHEKTRCTAVGCTLYGSTKKHKTFDMLNYVQGMLLEEKQNMRTALGFATSSVRTQKSGCWVLGLGFGLKK